MRNLKEYPITADEIVEYLRRVAAEKDQEDRVGDVGPLLLLAAADIVQAFAGHPKLFDALKEGR